MVIGIKHEYSMMYLISFLFGFLVGCYVFFIFNSVDKEDDRQIEKYKIKPSQKDNKKPAKPDVSRPTDSDGRGW